MDTTVEKLHYSFIRAESDGQFTLFIKTPYDIVDQDLEMLLMSDQKLLIRKPGKDYLTDVLPTDLFFHLKDRDTVTIFTDVDGKPLFAHQFPPFVRTS